MRLTADLARSALSYISPIGDRELDLRGHKIPAIENLGVAGGQDSIDFTDNDIAVIGNIPLTTRLHTLLLGRNRVQHIVPGLAKAVPRLRNLVLTANNMSELGDLAPLAECKELRHLVLLDNRVTTKENYRYYLIFLIPQLHTLDYVKIRDAERSTAESLFGTKETPSQLAAQIARITTAAPIINLDDDDDDDDAAMANGDGPAAVAAATAKRRKFVYTPAQRKYYLEAIRDADTMHDVERLQRDMAEGRIPKELVES